ncbi:MAG: response regulator transcription factor [Prevotella sp.]|nr:response regulator transcription factor [Prevotella sp.]
MANYILADNQDLTCFAVESLLRSDERNVVYRASDRAGLMQLLKEHESATVVLDYTLFDFADVEQLVIVSERFALSQWLLVSDMLSPAFLRKVVYATHQFSIIFKDCGLGELREALQTLSHHGRHISQRALEVVISQQHENEAMDILTETEREIVHAIAQGKTTKEIAAERYSSVHTVTTHRKNIFRKLGVNTAHEVVKYALRAGLIDQAEFYI